MQAQALSEISVTTAKLYFVTVWNFDIKNPQKCKNFIFSILSYFFQSIKQLPTHTN